jgi:hypothetical protein
MKIVIKITAVLAIVMGIMPIVTGSRVLFGFFDPGYQYFTILILYNIIMGSASVFVGIYIWRNHRRALFYSILIAGSHTIVLLLLLLVFNNIISDESVVAMTVRSALWIIFTIIVWKGNMKIQQVNSPAE